MNTLIDKNISSTQLSNLHRININNDDLNEENERSNKSIFRRLAEWLHLIKRWKDESIPEVCKHMYRSSLLSNSEQ